MIIRDIDPASHAYIARAVQTWGESKPVSVSLSILEEVGLLVNLKGSLRRESILPFSVQYQRDDGKIGFACTPRELHQAARQALSRYREEVARALSCRDDPGSPLPIRLRRASESDFRALLDFAHEVPELQVLASDARFPACLSSWLVSRHERSLFLLAHDEGDLVGFVYTTWKQVAEGTLHALALHPRVRRRGVGRELFSECLEVLRIAGVFTLRTVAPASARNFITSCGGAVQDECIRAEFTLRNDLRKVKNRLNDLEILYLRREALFSEAEKVKREMEALADQMAREACPFRVGQAVKSTLPPRGRFRVIEITCDDIRDEGARVEWRIRGTLMVADGDLDVYEADFTGADYRFGNLTGDE